MIRLHASTSKSIIVSYKVIRKFLTVAKCSSELLSPCQDKMLIREWPLEYHVDLALRLTTTEDSSKTDEDQSSAIACEHPRLYNFFFFHLLDEHCILTIYIPCRRNIESS